MMTGSEEKSTENVEYYRAEDISGYERPEGPSKVSSAGIADEEFEQKAQGKLVLDDGRIRAVREFLPPEQLYADLIARIEKYQPSEDISLIEKAYNIAYQAHKDQVRKSGEPYIIHPLAVAITLADLELDKESIIAGILHDVVEDTVMTEEDLAREFGDDVAKIVDGVTKLSKIKYKGDKLEMQADNLRKMFLAMANDIRVILIKLADRLHNMRTLKHMTEEKQQYIARETMDIYAPIANRLGVSKIKVELDDLSLKYLYPQAYTELVDKISLRKSDREKYIEKIVEEVTTHIKNAGIKAEIDGRIKHFYSIYKKMKNQGKTIDQIYDLFAVRIIVDDVKDCYAALGVIHEMYKPIPGRFKDYIAMPKANMYQSLHTTLIGPTGQPFEIQIRTEDMHKTAEFGIAAHWKYKEGITGVGKPSELQDEEKLSWLRQILEWQKDMTDNHEFMNVLKSDFALYSDHVYCFTPSGDVKNLPAGATPVDFAYSIHSAVGNKMTGARVNGRLVNIDYVIQNGDRVEILTSANSKGPSRDWLNIVKSSQARQKINQWFRSEFKDENIIKGKELLKNYCKLKNIDTEKIMTPEYMDFIRQKYGFNNWESICSAIGHGGLKEGQVINKMLEQYDIDHPKILSDEAVIAQVNEEAAKRVPSEHKGNGIIVRGIHDVAVRFSKCCGPLPGDEIVGFVTRGRGISIHRTDCINVMSMTEDDRGRLIEAEWAAPEGAFETYMAEINIYANNRHGLLADVTRIFSDNNIDINAVNSRTSKAGVATISVSFEISSKEALDEITKKIRNIESVVDIERTSS